MRHIGSGEKILYYVGSEHTWNTESEQISNFVKSLVDNVIVAYDAGRGIPTSTVM